MSRTVYKYQPNMDNVYTLPRYAKVVHLGEQQGTLCLWAEVDPEEPDVDRFRVERFGTGHPLPAAGRHLLTTFEGPFVWHDYLLPHKA